MAVSFHQLNHPFQGFGRTSYYKVRSGSALALASKTPSSCALLCCQETGASLEIRKIISASSKSSDRDAASASGSLLGPHANTVGIIGGMSAISGVKFIKKLISLSSLSNGECSVPFVLCSDPALHREMSSYERRIIQYSSKTLEIDNSRIDQKSSIVNNLLHKRKFLENSGIGCIVMPCHVSHLWYDVIIKGSSIPILHVGDCAVNELKQAKLKPVETGSPLRIGVIGTKAILSAGFYQEKLKNEGFEVILPDKASMERIIIPAAEALHRKDTEGARNLLRVALRVLLVKAVSTIILASDDMRDLLPEDDPLLKKCIYPMDALARSTVKWAQSINIG